MGIGQSFQGISGKRYEYLSISTKDLHATPRQAGNYIFARSDGSPIMISCALSLRKDIFGSHMWEIAKGAHEATLLLIHVDPTADERARNLEMMDLIDAYNPPMNHRA